MNGKGGSRGILPLVHCGAAGIGMLGKVTAVLYSLSDGAGVTRDRPS